MKKLFSRLILVSTFLFSPILLASSYQSGTDQGSTGTSTTTNSTSTTTPMTDTSNMIDLQLKTDDGQMITVKANPDDVKDLEKGDSLEVVAAPSSTSGSDNSTSNSDTSNQ